MDERAARELTQLRRYADGVAETLRRHPHRTDIADGARGYLGGALTTMLNLGVITRTEHDE
jgi:hypothetical protein